MRGRTVLALSLLVAVGLTGCGQKKTGTGVATAGHPSSGASATTGTSGLSDQAAMLKFAQCMRQNGVPNFPDPKFEQGGGVGINVPQGTDPKKAQAAQDKCKQFLPNGGAPQKMDPAQKEQLLKFAKCMRENGVPDFPDPSDDGIKINGGAGSGGGGKNTDLDPNNAKFKAAQHACASLQPSRPPGATDQQGTTSGSNG